mmetsp:Transcript_70889/g.140522  ORF Transcript_70889/g.140522 Transcript_70889/m.140522 type:complete len:229 (-) Transcript_70889:399-1085(-)
MGTVYGRRPPRNCLPGAVDVCHISSTPGWSVDQLVRRWMPSVYTPRLPSRTRAAMAAWIASSCSADCISRRARVRAVAVANIAKRALSSRRAARTGITSRVMEAWSNPAEARAATAFAFEAKWKKGSAGLPSSAAGRLTLALPCSLMASRMISKPLGPLGVCTSCSTWTLSHSRIIEWLPSAHTENASRPPGLRTRNASARACSGCGKCSRPNPMITESKDASGSGSF